MSKLFTSILLFIFLVLRVKAQNNTDSLALKIAQYPKQDSVKVEMLVDYCVSNTFSVSKQMLVYATEAYNISKNINYKLGQIRSLNCLGNYYYQQAIYEKAISFYTQALSLAEKASDTKNIIIGKSNLASLYARNKQTDKALVIFKELDEILVKTGAAYSQNRAAILTNTGMAYSSIGKHQQAVIYHKKVLEISEKLNIAFGVAISKTNIGEEYVFMNNPNEAIKYLKPTINLCLKNGFDNLLAQAYKNIGKAYQIKNDYDKSIYFLEKAKELSVRLNAQNSLLTINQKLYQVYAQKGEFQNAYLSALSYLAVNDSINGQEKQKIIADVSTKYETEKKEATIRNLNQKQKISQLESVRKSIYLYSVIGVFIAIALITYFLFSRYQIKQKNKLLQAQLVETEKLLLAEKKVTESELKALKSQMNPHFIFNALNSIQEQFMYGDKLKANAQLSNFTYLTRQILEVSGKKSISLSTEIEILEKYLGLEKMRFQNDFTYKISIQSELDEDYLKIPPMLIQPLVENSIKHGLLHKNGFKFLEITFKESNNHQFIICSVIDNGIGRKASLERKSLSHHLSFSTEAIIQRIKLLNPLYAVDELFIYTDLLDNEGFPNGTKAEISIPIVS
jgi:tetratricopeptide (TPR) repeat protein